MPRSVRCTDLCRGVLLKYRSEGWFTKVFLATSWCPEMHANEMHELYDRHHKVSPTLNSYQNTNNSVKREVLLKQQKGLSYIKYPKSGLGAFLDISDFVASIRSP